MNVSLLLDVVFSLLELYLEMGLDSLAFSIAEGAPVCTPDGVCTVPTTSKPFMEMAPPEVPNVNNDKSLTRKILETVFSGFSFFAFYLIYTMATEGTNSVPPADIDID